MCQSPHSLTAGERYSLFQPTAGLSLATGEHAGKWVTVNTVCLPHICSTSTVSTPRKGMTPRQRTKETVSKCATSPPKITAVVLQSRGAARWHVYHFAVVMFPHDRLLQQWVETFLIIQRLMSEAGRVIALRPSQYSGDEARLRYSAGSNHGHFRDEKTTPRINECVACWEAWFTHVAAERTCWIKGDSAVLPEHNSWIWAGKSMVISNLATFLRTPG